MKSSSLTVIVILGMGLFLGYSKYRNYQQDLNSTLQQERIDDEKTDFVRQSYQHTLKAEADRLSHKQIQLEQTQTNRELAQRHSEEQARVLRRQAAMEQQMKLEERLAAAEQERAQADAFAAQLSRQRAEDSARINQEQQKAEAKLQEATTLSENPQS